MASVLRRRGLSEVKDTKRMPYGNKGLEWYIYKPRLLANHQKLGRSKKGSLGSPRALRDSIALPIP